MGVGILVAIGVMRASPILLADVVRLLAVTVAALVVAVTAALVLQQYTAGISFNLRHSVLC